MAQFTEEELKLWFDMPECNQISKSDGSSTNILVKTPFNREFNLLFYSRAWHDNKIELNANLESAGLYCKKDGNIYNSSYSLRQCCEKTDMIIGAYRKEDFSAELSELVRSKVEEIIGNNKNNLSVKELTDERLLNRVSYYYEHGAASDAEKEFLNGKDISDIVYKCPFNVDSMSDNDYIAFILNKEDLVENKANTYINENQEKILACFLENALLKKELQSIYDDPQNLLRRVKSIIDTVKEAGAKTVNVTIKRDNKDLTFKYEAEPLKFAPGNYYSTYYMKASDRREFENLFGKSAVFYPDEITQITYGRNVIYDSSEFNMEETEDASMAQTM